jgi:SIR2-like domain
LSQESEQGLTNRKLQPATTAGVAGKASIRRKALDGLDWYLAGDEPPQVKKDGAGLWQPSFLFRGRENWLARLPEGEDKKPPVKDIQQEARALVARWLKMQNVCVLVGAGASTYVTKFVTSGLFAQIQTILKDRPSGKTLDALLSFCSDSSKIALRFEDFLSQVSGFVHLSDIEKQPLDRLRLDPALITDKTKGLTPKALRELLLDIERAIIVSCNVSLPPSALVLAGEDLSTHESFFSKLLARDPLQGRARIFTLNYDTLIEQALDRLGAMYWDGFAGTISRRFDPSTYALDWHYPGEVTEGRVRRYDKAVHLYKLHGSVNWRRTVRAAQNPFGIEFAAHQVPTMEEWQKDAKVLDDTLGEGEGLAILPTAAKYGESLAMPYAHLFRSLGQSLQQSQTALFVTGYGGWDSHINQVVEDALTNPGFICVFVDPKPSDWALRLCKADHCGRVYCFGGQWGTFEAFSDEVMPDLEALSTDLEVARTLRELQKAQTPQAE